MLSEKEISQRLSEIAGFCIEIRKVTYFPKGAKLTKERLDLIKRLANKVIILCEDMELRGLNE